MSAYGNFCSKSEVKLPYFPVLGETKARLRVKLVEYEPKYESELHNILKTVVDEGLTYPFESMDAVEDFRLYYLSHRCFVCLGMEDEKVLGGFYVKPNFPGRSGHICNAGFIVGNEYRGLGVATFMVPHYLQIARDLGYEGSFFNLVYVSNVTSMKLWENFGFQRAGLLPKAGRLKGLGYVDAIQYFYDLTQIAKSQGVE